MLESGHIIQERYQLQEKLGQNASRQTWLAVDLAIEPSQDNLLVAPLVILKLLAFSPQMQWDELKLFEREAEVLKQLNHPRIPLCRDSFMIEQHKEGGLSWFGLVQDYIPGVSLRQLLAQGQCFTAAQVQSLAKGVLEILIYLHELSPPVLHRDIKPSNLILGEDEQVYLIDFGAVQNRAAVEGATFTVVGSTGYAPLEQFWGRAVPASDLYALGATLIHLLTGTAPADLPQRNLRIQFRDRVSINPSLVRWISAIADPDLEQRFSSARQALEALETGETLDTSGSIISPPPRTQVQLRKSVNHLTINIPQRGLKLGAIARFGLKFIQAFSLLTFLLVYSLFVGVCCFELWMDAITLTHLQEWHNWIHYIPQFLSFLAIPIFLLWGWISGCKLLLKILENVGTEFFTAFSNSCFYVDSNKFAIERRLFGYGYHRLWGKTIKIKEISSQGVTIKTNRKQYQLGHKLTQSECDWLAQEIQEWLY